MRYNNLSPSEQQKVQMVKDLLDKAMQTWEDRIDQQIEDYLFNKFIKEGSEFENNRNRHGVEWPDY